MYRVTAGDIELLKSLSISEKVHAGSAVDHCIRDLGWNPQDMSLGIISYYAYANEDKETIFGASKNLRKSPYEISTLYQFAYKLGKAMFEPKDNDNDKKSNPDLEKYRKPAYEAGPGGHVYVDSKQETGHIEGGAAHYKAVPPEYEAYKVIKAWGHLGNGNIFNALKYLARLNYRGKRFEDLIKARDYINYEIGEELEKKANQDSEKLQAAIKEEQAKMETMKSVGPREVPKWPQDFQGISPNAIIGKIKCELKIPDLFTIDIQADPLPGQPFAAVGSVSGHDPVAVIGTVIHALEDQKYKLEEARGDYSVMEESEKVGPRGDEEFFGKQ